VTTVSRQSTTTEFDINDYVDGVAAFIAGTANVIMQLALAPVGHGVVESTVESGQITRHPVKRSRTTLSYLSVAIYGSDEERAAYRDAVNRSHRQVRSRPDSPVKYNAFDTDLQLWVAACIYWGFVDVYTALHGPLPEDQAEWLYQRGARFGTTLQVPQDHWPADRAAFERYWADGLTKISIDETVREYLHGLVMLEHLPWLLRIAGRRLSRLLTTGFLPPLFREQMQLTWTARDQRRFDAHLRRVAIVNRLLPGPIRRFPFNALMWDVRRRITTGRPLV
jgi:uncharacterized protein (DUF2236 family)